MSSEIGKTPFFRLLIPVITGIVISSCLPDFSYYSKLISGISGIIIIFISFIIGNRNRFHLRWLFGAGTFLFIVSLTQVQYHQHEKKALYNFNENTQYYIGTITDIPKIKPKTIACDVKINNQEGKKVILYIQQDDRSYSLKPGDEIVFQARIQAFRNFEKIDTFDYVRYMKIKGYSGSAYIPSTAWENTNRKSVSLYTISQRFRLKALNFYKSFELSDDTYSLISALTLGYKEDLTEDLREAFRISGTAHVLAVSGLHVGIIYVVISLLFSFLRKQGTTNKVKQLIIIIMLWSYVFIAGMSASVIRAAIMLTINCIAKIFNRRGFTYNTLSAAAYFILIYRPFYLFDISFQMSFAAVVAILFFMPKFNILYTPSNIVAKYVYNLFTISLSAQLGVFPLVLFYFGTFPTYFIITNILVVPLIGVIIYSVVPLIIISLLTHLNIKVFELLFSIFQWFIKTATEITIFIVYKVEMLPLAQISNISISVLQLLLLFTITFSFGHWLFSHRSKSLIIALSSILMFSLTSTYTLING